MPLRTLFCRIRTAAKTRKLAQTLFPGEKWVKVEPHIRVAVSRMDERTREPDKWEREMSQARILTNRGSVAYFLPERTVKGPNATLCADMVLDGVVTEMKTVSGSRVTLGTEFRFAHKQGAVLVAGHSKFENTGELYSWTYDELRALIDKKGEPKNHPAL
ncbi:MAG: hypothetical protein LBK64_02535 [Spirochaetaceae bacterium]|jgi:hypothetical protein|nr:hypothetical protein [Spirochaetaceae bacterium]